MNMVYLPIELKVKTLFLSFCKIVQMSIMVYFKLTGI